MDDRIGTSPHETIFALLQCVLDPTTLHCFWIIVKSSALVIAATYVVYYRWLHPCAAYPGPFICSITNLWKVWAVLNERMIDDLLLLHEKHGPVVRIGPSDLSFNDPAAFWDIYRSGWPKGRVYDGFAHHYPGLFDERNEKKHAERKRLVAPCLSMQVMKSMDDTFDQHYAILRRKLNRFAETGEAFDLRRYIAFCVADTLGQLAFGQSFESQKDEDLAKLPQVSRASRLCLAAGQLPWCAGAIKKFPLFKADRILHSMRRMIPEAMKSIEKRAKSGLVQNDILGRIIAAREKRMGESLVPRQILTEATDLIFGGTDTTIETTCILLANLSRNSSVMARVVDEIDKNIPPLANNEAAVPLQGLESKLDFVHAAIRESMRKDPVTAWNMSRTTPKEGGTVAGIPVPAGAECFMNIHLYHHNPDLWGNDHAIYDPDRWYDDRAKDLKRFAAPFLVGSRKCVGEHYATAHLLKMLTTLLKAYHFEWINADEEMIVKTHGATILKTPLLVRCSVR